MERRLKESMYGERTLVCVCVYMCLRAKGKTILFHRRRVGR